MPSSDQSPERAPAHAELETLCRSGQEFVQRALGLTLDYRSETLPLLDHYVRTARKDIAERPELLPLLARVLGAYFGEVLVREQRMFWRIPSVDEHGWRVCCRSAFCAVNPVGVAYAALVGSAEHPGPSSELHVAREDREYVALRLESLPEERDEDFFRFSTRYDAIEIVCAALSDQMRQDGQGDVEFEESDYEDAEDD